MGHLTTRDAYKNLEERINWFTQGAPPSDTLYKILQVLYTEKEAKWASLLLLLKKLQKYGELLRPKQKNYWTGFAKKLCLLIPNIMASVNLSCLLRWQDL